MHICICTYSTLHIYIYIYIHTLLQQQCGWPLFIGAPWDQSLCFERPQHLVRRISDPKKGFVFKDRFSICGNGIPTVWGCHTTQFSCTDVYQRKFSWETSELLMIAMVPPFCQPHQRRHHHHHHHHQEEVGKCNSATGRERVNSGLKLKRLSGAKPCLFLGKVASKLAEGGSLFPRLRGLIGESCRQKAHRTLARARIALEYL